MSYHHLPLVNESGLASAHRELGTAFSRLLGYFRQDGMASISAIDAAMHERDATGMVVPAHRLKGESRQFAASRLSQLSEYLEMTARRCIEDRVSLPDALGEDVRGLRAVFQQTIAQLDEHLPDETPHIARLRPVPALGQRPTFGRRNL